MTREPPAGPPGASPRADIPFPIARPACAKGALARATRQRAFAWECVANRGNRWPKPLFGSPRTRMRCLGSKSSRKGLTEPIWTQRGLLFRRPKRAAREEDVLSCEHESTRTRKAAKRAQRLKTGGRESSIDGSAEDTRRKNRKHELVLSCFPSFVFVRSRERKNESDFSW